MRRLSSGKGAGIPPPKSQIRLASRIALTVCAIAALSPSQLSSAAPDPKVRCCLKITANVLGTLSLEFPQEPRMAWQGRRDYSWSAQEMGLFQVEDVGGGWLFYELYPRNKIKGGASEVGTLTYNFRSPDPPDASRGEPEVSNCEQAMSTGQKWKWTHPAEPAGEAELLEVNTGGTELEVTILRRIMDMDHDDVTPFAKSGDCDHELVDHHEWFEVDGYPTTTFPEIPVPAPLRGRGLPSLKQLREKSPFKSEKKEYPTGGHQPAGPISNSTHHTTGGSVRLKWVRFEYFPKERLNEEIQAFKKLE